MQSVQFSDAVISFQYSYIWEGDDRITTLTKTMADYYISTHHKQYPSVRFKIISIVALFMYMPLVRRRISVIKYIPQIVTNHQRRSTTGISTTSVILEATVGPAIVSQVTLDVINNNAISLILGNFSKLLDGTSTLFGNRILLLQIFWYEKRAKWWNWR